MSTSGVAAMPGPRSNKAPFFSGKENDSLANFLLEYEVLADTHGLTTTEKVETIMRYVPATLHKFWRTLEGYGIKSWTTFTDDLEGLYLDTLAATCSTKKALQDFVDSSSWHRIRNEDDMIAYHRHFLEISNHLYNAGDLSDDEQNSEFFQGFHPDDREVLASWLFSMNPRHPTNKPYTFKVVLSAAKSYFSKNQFYRPAHHQNHSNYDNDDEDHPATPDYQIRQ